SKQWGNAISPYATCGRSTTPTATRFSRSYSEETTMSSVASPSSSDLAPLLDLRHAGHGMPRPFYVDEALYAAEMEKIWRQGWIFAGFAFEIPKPGDFLT